MLRQLALCLLAAPSVAFSQSRQPSQKTREDHVYEASIVELQRAMTDGRLSSVDLVDEYVARIRAYDDQGPSLNAIIRLNPKARADAAALDAERKAGKVRGPLHGIPILLKDNYSTRDFLTSAGSIALASLQTPDDAFQVRKLRDAGAVILGKTNMHELASGITTISSIGGQTCNPYDPTRNPGGSSGGSGAAVAASFAALAWGSDTCGSIRIPAAVQNLFGLRPTKGLSSIAGIVPLSHSQDVGGPLARTVMDLAIGLDATIGADPMDSATAILADKPLPHFVESLDTTALRGKRIGVLVAHLGTEMDDAEGTRVIRTALEKMKARGATVIDIDIPPLDTLIARAGVIDYEFKDDLREYLARVPRAPVWSLSQIVSEGLYHTALTLPLRRRDSLGSRDSEAYRAAYARRAVARRMVTAFLDSMRLDAIAYPTMRRKAAIIGEPPRGGNCQLSAVTGLPALTMPAGLTADGLPIGVELLGRALDDARLLALAYDYEQSAQPRVAPSTTPPLVDGKAPAPSVWLAIVRDSTMSARGLFRFDAPQRSLTYDIAVSDAPASTIYAVSIDRDSAGLRKAMLHRLSGPGVTAIKGSVTIPDSERRDLLEGRLALVVYSKRYPRGTMRVPIVRR